MHRYSQRSVSGPTAPRSLLLGATRVSRSSYRSSSIARLYLSRAEFFAVRIYRRLRSSYNRYHSRITFLGFPRKSSNLGYGCNNRARLHVTRTRIEETSSWKNSLRTGVLIQRSPREYERVQHLVVRSPTKRNTLKHWSTKSTHDSP